MGTEQAVTPGQQSHQMWPNQADNPGPNQNVKISEARVADVRTARAVGHLYDALWDQHPPTTTSEQRNAVSAARRRATESHWAPPLAWDDIDADPGVVALGTCPDPDGVDEIAVDRAVHGDHIRLAELTSEEPREAMRR